MPKESSNDELLLLLRGIDRKLSALLAVSVDQSLRSSEGLAKPRPRTIDRLLSDAGLLGTEIARTLGKSPQAVSQVLASDAKTRAGKQSDAPQSAKETSA